MIPALGFLIHCSVPAAQIGPTARAAEEAGFVALEQPPSMPPPILIGATGPRSIAVAGRAADGLILPEGCPPAFVAAARELLDAGAPAGRRSLLVTYVWLSLATHADAARDVLRPHVAERIARPDASRLLEPAGLAGPVAELFQRVPPAERPGELPTAWIDGIAVVGSPDGVAASLQAYADAGADTIVLTPPEPADAEAQLAAAARDLVPRVR